jgi:beta-glucosidase-like glycosyl hydrolase/CubicO group peptidase (beta-lactamase class C family)
MRHTLVAVAVLVSVGGCSHSTPPPTPPVIPDPYAVLPPVQVPSPSKITAEALLETLSVREKAGQLVIPWLLGNYTAFDSEEFDSLATWIDSLNVGGIIISVGPPLEITAKLNALQARSPIPLLIAADLEWGSGMRLRGGTSFPMPMAIAATGRVWDAYELGRITALEAKSVGIHMTFSPVADLNNNPNNPIINTRSFGESPERVAPLIGAYIRGATEHGLYTTAKHFPGHGDTDLDSHIELPLVSACWNRLDTLELAPFRVAVRAGVTAVMTAHVAVPCLTVDSLEPATLSDRIMSAVLRDSLDFEGLVVTDALTMGAIVRQYGPGESAVRAFLAGSDLLLIPADPRAAIDAIVAAVDSGRITLERLDRSVERLLTLKQDAGLFDQRLAPLDSVMHTVGQRDFQALAEDMAARSLTLVERGPMDEFRERRGTLAVIAYGRETNLSLGGRLVSELRRLGDTATSFRLFPASGVASYDSARAVIDNSPRVVFAINVPVVSGLGHVAMPDSLAALILATQDAKPTVLASFGNPYLLSQVPDYRGSYLLAWSDIRPTELAVARALAGGAEIQGTLPITLSPDHAAGSGMRIPAAAQPDSALATGVPDPRLAADPTFDAARLEGVTRFLESQVADGAFPGGVMVVGHRGAVVYRTAVGRYGEDDPRPVTDSTVYDMASLTKVVGLTTAAMLLVAEGKLDLDRPVQEYVPGFTGPRKAEVLVRHLLTHTSGLPAWVPLHLATANREDAVRRVLEEPLASRPDDNYVYSDLGAITLAQVVEAAAEQPLDEFLDIRVFQPLGMRYTRFLPPASWRPFTAPTERDPWRGRVLRGEVHDENAARLGGVSGHAGLFSTGPDLARFALWILDAYHGRLPIDAPVQLPATVVREFTRRQPGPEGSTRALGWDTPTPGGGRSSGTMLSPASFGHTGFTGTSIWIDPQKEVFIILLTNRVHPTRENRALLSIRGMVADSVLSALR